MLRGAFIAALLAALRQQQTINRAEIVVCLFFLIVASLLGLLINQLHPDPNSGRKGKWHYFKLEEDGSEMAWWYSSVLSRAARWGLRNPELMLPFDCNDSCWTVRNLHS